MYRDDRRSSTPVEVGQEITVKIEAVGEKGDGIAKVKGFVIFIPNAKQDEEVKVRITRVLRKVAFAEVIGGASTNREESSENTEESDTEESEEDF